MSADITVSIRADFSQFYRSLRTARRQIKKIRKARGRERARKRGLEIKG